MNDDIAKTPSEPASEPTKEVAGTPEPLSRQPQLAGALAMVDSILAATRYGLLRSTPPEIARAEIDALMSRVAALLSSSQSGAGLITRWHEMLYGYPWPHTGPNKRGVGRAVLRDVLRSIRRSLLAELAMESGQDPALEPDMTEAALFGATTERFYGSWAMKIALGALGLAAGFAIYGSITIGVQTANLRDRLQEAGKLGEEQVRRFVDDAKNDTRERQQSLSEKATIIQLQSDALTKAIGDGRTEINNAVQELTKSKEDLKEKALNQIIKDVEAGLAANNKDLTARLAEEQTKVHAAVQGANELERKLSDLRAVVDENQDFVLKIKDIHGYVEAAHGDAEAAHSDAGRALESRIMAESNAQKAASAEKSMSTALDTLPRQMIDYTEAIGGLEQTVRDLKRRARDLDTSLSDSEGELSIKLALKYLPKTIKDIDDRDNQMQTSINKLNQQVALIKLYPQEKSVSQLPVCATQKSDGCMRLQVALFAKVGKPADRKNPRKPMHDGTGGPATLAAIKSFQQSLGADQTGILTDDQVKALVGNSQPP